MGEATAASLYHTHIKPASWLYVWLAPLAWVYTRVAVPKERDEAQRGVNVAIRRALMSPSLLFGESLMLPARKR